MTDAERLAAFEAMRAAVQADYDRTTEKMAELRTRGEENKKSATYRQLFANKLTMSNILALYKLYGLAEPDEKTAPCNDK